MAIVDIPSVGGVTRSLGKYGQGLIGGVVYTFASNMLGSGLVGGAVSSALAGAAIRGDAGDTIATIGGFASGQSLLADLGLMGGNQTQEEALRVL